MRFLLGLDISGRAFLSAGWRQHSCVSAVAIGAAEAYGSGGMHGCRIGLTVAGHAARAVSIRFGTRFPKPRLSDPRLSQQERTQQKCEGDDSDGLRI